MPGPMGRRTGDTKESLKQLRASKGTILRLLKYLRKYKWQMVLVLVMVVIGALSDLIMPLFTKYLIDDIITPLIGQQAPDWSGLAKAVLIFGGIYAVCIGCSYVQSRLEIVITQGMQKDIRDEMFARMQRLPLKYFDTHSHGDIMSVYTNDIDTLRQLISQSVPQTFSALISVIATLVMMIVLSWPLTLLALAMVWVMLAVARRIGGKSAKHFVDQQANLGKVNGYVEEMISGEKVVKVFCREEKTGEQFDALNEALCDSSIAANKYANIVMPVMGNISNLQYVLTAIVGSALSISGISMISVGSLISFLQLCKGFTRPISMISQQVNSIAMAMAGATRIFALIDEKPETDEGRVSLVSTCCGEDGSVCESPYRTGSWAWRRYNIDGACSYTPLRGDVDFDNITFGYKPGKTILHGITVFSDPGQKTAFVGSTGAGKTTIMNLLTRFYDIPPSGGSAPLSESTQSNAASSTPEDFGSTQSQAASSTPEDFGSTQSQAASSTPEDFGSTQSQAASSTPATSNTPAGGGKITYDGIDIRDIRKDDLRRSLGMVLQDTYLFTGTIADNIRYGNLSASDADVRAAAQLAHADRFINLLPDGYNTMLTDNGSELSQGQCQLLAIARAAIANTPVLILDEATSSIDTRTEKLVQHGLDNLMRGRTVFVIAHRLSTIRDADKILVLEKGRITESGSNAELLALHGTYWRLNTGALELA
jgi:ATP-binding cassette subfamily B multidrug efflux pump